MSITVYSRRNFKGEDVTGFDLDNFRQLAHPIIPTSVKLTAADDKILFFTHVKWTGRVMFRSGVQEIANLGHRDDGGEIGFENTITGMRVKPFTLPLRFHVVTDANGAFPGGMSSLAQVTQSVESMVEGAKEVWSPRLINFKLESIVVPSDVSKFFDMDHEFYKLMAGSRKFDRLKGGANVVLVNQVAPDLGGQAIPHALSHMVLVDARPLDNGLTLAHELGHFFGLLHRDHKAPNLMDHDIVNAGLSNAQVTLTTEQVEDAHESFANFSALEKGVRVE